MGIILLFLAFGLVFLSLIFTKENKKNRILTGFVLMISILTYPLSLPLLHELNILKGLEGTAMLIIFYFILLIGGIITLMAGLFTKTKLKDSISEKGTDETP